MSFNITELKKHLGPGLGLRTNSYLVEIPSFEVDGVSLNMLCNSAGLPEIKVSTSEVWFKGHKTIMRAETASGGEYEISITDDSDMKVRAMFDKWIRMIEEFNRNAHLRGGSASYEVKTPGGAFFDTASTQYDEYQTDINIWQLDGEQQKVYGYKLNHAFPTSLGIVTLGDEDSNKMSQFSIVFTHSGTTPLFNDARKEPGEGGEGKSGILGNVLNF